MIVLPTIIVQIVAIYVFFYTYVDNISKHMARGIIGEMRFIKESIAEDNNQELASKFAESVDLEFDFIPQKKLKNKTVTIRQKRENSKILDLFNPFPIVDALNRFKIELENQGFFPYYISKFPGDDNYFILTTQVENGIIKFIVPEKRVTSSAKYVFTIWLIFTAILTSLIAILFLKNQIRSIEGLSMAAEKLGRGENVPEFKPSGAKEIRSLGLAFIKMRDRIIRQISSRTEMLSAVSHDLRTPLTRMKLELEMMGKDEAIKELKSDISDMENMINEYLDFSRSGDTRRETSKKVNIKDFLEEIVKYYHKMKKEIDLEMDFRKELKIPLKKLTFKRAMRNLIDNSFEYADEVKISACFKNNFLQITVDDNGPGIPQEKRNEIFKPFFRMDDSRNLDKNAGAGLGLAIVMDVVNSHGGKIEASESPQKGLRMIIYLPV